jgi:hypothetical protein
VEFSAKHIKVLLDGKPYIELEDGHITGAGAVRVWTEADSVTGYDDFSFGEGRRETAFIFSSLSATGQKFLRRRGIVAVVGTLCRRLRNLS